MQIVVEVAGTVCDVDCSIFSQTVDRQRPPTADQSLACQSSDRSSRIKFPEFSSESQCFDAVGWAAGRASGL